MNDPNGGISPNAFQAVMDGEVKKARHIVTVSGGVEYPSKISSRKVFDMFLCHNLSFNTNGT